MRIRNRRTWAALGLLLLVLGGCAAYEAVLHWRGNSHLRAARRALERHDCQQASIHLKMCLDARPNELAARLLAAQTARRQGNFDEARWHLTFCKGKKWLKEALKLENRLLSMQEGDLEESDWMLAFCANNPEAPETSLILDAIIEGSLAQLENLYIRLAHPFDSAGRMAAAPHLTRVTEAVELYRKVQRNEAGEVQVLMWRGRLHCYSNEYPKGVAALRQAVELAPDHFQARLHLALRVSQEAPMETAYHLEILRQREPENLKVLFSLASCRRSLGDLEEARQLLDQILAASSGERPWASSAASSAELASLIERGLVELDDKKLDEAERWLRKALLRAPESPEINNSLGTCLQLAGRTDEAKKYQEKFQQLEAQKRR